MAKKKKPCGHCKAVRTIISRGLCMVCYKTPEIVALFPAKTLREGVLGERKKKFKDGGPTSTFTDEPDAPDDLRAARWIAHAGKLALCENGHQEAFKDMLANDAAKFVATLKTLEVAWSEKKAARSDPPTEAPVSPRLFPDAADVPLDEVSARVVEQIDRWLEDHRRRACAPRLEREKSLREATE